MKPVLTIAIAAFGAAFCLTAGERLAQAAETTAAVQQNALPRVVIALYDSRQVRPFETATHRMAELPLNHLGLVLRYQDINAPYPSPQDMADVRGILCWLEESEVSDPEPYMRWAEAAVAAGKKLVMVGGIGVPQDGPQAVSGARLNRFLETIGLTVQQAWSRNTYNVHFVTRDPSMVDYERPLGGVLQTYQQIVPVDPKAHSYLVARSGDDPTTDSHLVTVTSKGGYVAADYVYYSGHIENEQQWYINPLEFFREAFDTDDLPKADTTTLAGRRIFYSHIDGDGWNNVSELPRYQQRGEISAKVLYDEIFKKYPDLPVTVAPIAADIDPARGGLVEARDIARQILALPNVEAGTHTYTHPFVWDFYANYSADREKPYLVHYDTLFGRFIRTYRTRQGTVGESGDEAEGKTPMPRAYFDKPFDVHDEIVGSRDYIQSLLPPGKRVKTIQWSGDALPFEAALAAAKTAGLANINGGDSRFDRDFPSLSWIAPIGRNVGDYWQIYASNSNENTYTELWNGRFYGFRYLVDTVRHSESPVRLKPMNVYYHFYSGQKWPSLAALRTTLDYARGQPLVPIATSQFVHVAEGFYTARIEHIGDHSWRIENRGQLETIRFDHASGQAVDLAHSIGVIGFRHVQGSLYVYLDAAQDAPEITLVDDPTPWAEPSAARPYLVESSWPVWQVDCDPDHLRFETQGFGSTVMTWRVAPHSRWQFSADTQNVEVEADASGLLHVALPPLAIGTQSQVTAALIKDGI